MFLRADFNGWGLIKDGLMTRVNHFTWGSNVTLSGFSRAKFAPQQADRELVGGLASARAGQSPMASTPNGRCSMPCPPSTPSEPPVCKHRS